MPSVRTPVVVASPVGASIATATAMPSVRVVVLVTAAVGPVRPTATAIPSVSVAVCPAETGGRFTSSMSICVDVEPASHLPHMNVARSVVALEFHDTVRTADSVHVVPSGEVP